MGQVVAENRHWSRRACCRDCQVPCCTNEVPGLVADMSPYRRWIDPLLRDAAAQAEARKEPRKQLHASLALLPVDPAEVTYLVDRLLDAAPHEVGVIRDALAPHKDGLLEKLWTVVEKPDQAKEAQRLRAATALALYDPDNPQWDNASPPVVKNLSSRLTAEFG